MCSTPDDLALIKARHEEFIAAFNDATDIDRVMSFFSPEISYSDYSNCPLFSLSCCYYLTFISSPVAIIMVYCRLTPH